jgi:hypothetical protein
MSDEIDEFIRRAAERRKQGQGQRKTQQRPAQSAPSPVARERTRPRMLQPEVLDAEIVSAEVVPDIATSVSQHLDTRTSHFGEEPGLADDRVEARLHQTFDHKLGQLTQSGPIVAQQTTVRSATDNAAEVTTSPANEALGFLINALRTPQNLRQAVILGEILTRPEHDW